MTREDLSQFLDEVIKAKMMDPGNPLPAIETSRAVITHYNRQNLKAFDETGYFIIQGVRVCEKGKLQNILERDSLTTDQVNFGGK